MNTLPNSEGALDKFAEKIDFTKLEGKPEDFYKAGIAFVENGKFDDGIPEFVKIIKTVSHQESLFINAVKELKSMGFSVADISSITGVPGSGEGIIADPIATTSLPAGSKSNTVIASVMMITIIIVIFGCVSIFSDTSPDGYERSGNFLMAVVVLGPFYF